jgi:hypothetical protein
VIRPGLPHSPRVVSWTRVIYASRRDYYRNIPQRYIYRTWIQMPVADHYNDGYWEIGGYPYYVYEGYGYRYNPVETCQYQLVDGEDYKVAITYNENACDFAYNECAQDRDQFNTEVGMDRFFCAEAVDSEYTNDGTGYDPLPTSIPGPTPVPVPVPAPQISAAHQAQINSLIGMSHKDVWKQGWYKGVGECAIVKLSGNPLDCRWIVKSGNDWAPEVDGSVCSQSLQAMKVGCAVGDEKQNIGCILKKAVTEGKCL